MAYLDTREPMLAPHFPATVAIDGGFERHEWKVVALARRDSLASLREPSRLTRLLAALFGEGINRRLANPRLEALRRFAVLAWHHGYALPVSAIKAIKEAGFTVEQVEMLLANVAVSRVHNGRGYQS